MTTILTSVMRRFGWLMSLYFLNTCSLAAQNKIKPDHDTIYYESYHKAVIGRIYLSQKYTTIELKKGNDAPRLRYRPNTSLNLGVGATYHTISLNLSYGFGFLNHDKEKGTT